MQLKEHAASGRMASVRTGEEQRLKNLYLPTLCHRLAAFQTRNCRAPCGPSDSWRPRGSRAQAQLLVSRNASQAESAVI